jgi:hypothetical protein
MDRIPLPSRVHYELLLQVLERQTLPAARPTHQPQVQQLIITLRKALSQQKQLEDVLQQSHVVVDYRWSMHEENPPTSPSISPNP